MSDEEFVENLINGNVEHIKISDHPETWLRHLIWSAISYGSSTGRRKQIDEKYIEDMANAEYYKSSIYPIKGYHTKQEMWEDGFIEGYTKAKGEKQ